MRPFVLLLVLLAAGCAAPPRATAPEAAPPTERVPLVLISLDGVRHDYLERGRTPTLGRIAAAGVRAERLVPVFPTLTFPTHYSLVTGLHPQRHGVVGNTMHDDALGSFSLGNRAAISDGRWWGGEPLWATAERQGVRTATMFWPGSEAAIGGVRPTTWMPYDDDLPYEARVDSVVAWLARPAATRPGLVTLYLSAVDTAGHRFGPDAPETDAQLARVDAVLARLLAGLGGRAVNVVVVSDHGMAELAPERTVYLDDALDVDAETERVIWGATTLVWPRPGREAAVLEALGRLEGLRAFRREQTPARLHFRGHPRIAPLVLLADEGWTVTTRASEARRGPARGGTHGYDNALPSMHGILVASGPAFGPGGRTVGPFAGVDLYEALCAALGVRPAPNDGDARAARALLQP